MIPSDTRTVLDLFSLTGKTAVVTGGAGYLGKVFCQALLEAGASVVLMGRGEKVQTAAETYQAVFGKDRVDMETVDFHDTDAFRSSLARITARHRSVDILVNNAFEFSQQTGFNDPSGSIESLSKSQWLRALESGVYWQALSTQVIGPHMVAQRSGSIINISSMYALVSPDPQLYEGTPILNPPVYSTCKAALLGLTRYTASFYGSKGVRCNALLPGAFPNVGGDSYNAPRNEDFLSRLSQRTVLGRYGNPDDLKGAIVFLASDGSCYITGQTLVVDGGWTVR